MNKIINISHLFITIILLLPPVLGVAQQSTQVLKQVVKGYEIETGYFFNGQPYAKAGNGEKVLIHIEAISFDHKPPEGFYLKQFIQQNESFYDEYTVYQIGRKPNLPEGYSIEQMSKDYGLLLSQEFNAKVDVIGLSTGGQIGLCLAANFPEEINKLVIVSAAYQVGEQGKLLEKKAAEYYAQKKYGKTMATFMEVVYEKGFKRSFYKAVMKMVGRSMLKDVEYPNDFQVEVMADINMDFKDRLHEIEATTLVVIGEKDLGYDLADVKETAAGIANSQLITYEKYGHDLYPDNYKEVNKDILKFLNQVL